MPDQRHVVVGVDGSDDNRDALRRAALEATAHGARLEVLHAWNFLDQPGPKFDPHYGERAARMRIDRFVDETTRSRPAGRHRDADRQRPRGFRSREGFGRRLHLGGRGSWPGWFQGSSPRFREPARRSPRFVPRAGRALSVHVLSLSSRHVPLPRGTSWRAVLPEGLRFAEAGRRRWPGRADLAGRQFMGPNRRRPRRASRTSARRDRTRPHRLRLCPPHHHRLHQPTDLLLRRAQLLRRRLQQLAPTTTRNRRHLTDRTPAVKSASCPMTTPANWWPHAAESRSTSSVLPMRPWAPVEDSVEVGRKRTRTPRLSRGSVVGRGGICTISAHGQSR